MGEQEGDLSPHGDGNSEAEGGLPQDLAGAEQHAAGESAEGDGDCRESVPNRVDSIEEARSHEHILTHR